jgi:sugar lactone lactonase YvrE
MQIWKAELLYKTDLILGEGAFWHTDWKKFLYIHIEGKKVGCIDPLTKIIEEKNVRKRVGMVVPSGNGKLIVALQASIEEFDFVTGERKGLIKIENDKPDNRCNDGKCDAAG